MYSFWSRAGSSALQQLRVVERRIEVIEGEHAEHCRTDRTRRPRYPAIAAASAARSISGCSIQSTSPVCSAAAAVEGSFWVIHSTRSKCTTLPPEMYSGFSCRGTYLSNLAQDACAPATHSSFRNRNGPDPTYSFTCSVAGVFAIRSGMMNRPGCRARTASDGRAYSGGSGTACRREASPPRSGYADTGRTDPSPTSG